MKKIKAFSLTYLFAIIVPSLAQVSWDVNNTEEFKNGDTMELICTVAGSCCSTSRKWNGGPSFTFLMNDGVPSDSNKYGEIINSNSFSLLIYNVDRSDFLYDYRCTDGFVNSARSVVSPPGNARYVPAASEIQEISLSTVDEKLNFEVNVTTVFPAPSCTAEFGGADISSSMTLTTTDDFPFKFAILSMSNKAYTCPGSLDVSCSVGSYSFNVLTIDPCLIPATPSSQMTSEMESSFLEVTGTVDYSNVLPSFESTDFPAEPGTSINANTLSLEDGLPRISPLSSIGSLELTDMLNNEYKTTGIEVDSSLFSLNSINFTDETIAPGMFNSAISTSMVTSSRNNLQTSSVSVLYITTGISIQMDLTQSRDLQIQTSEIIQNTQKQYTSLHSSILLHTQTSNIQTNTIPSSLSTRFDATYSDTLSLQSTPLVSFIMSLVSKDKSSADTFSLSIETSPASPVQPVDTSSNNQLYSSGYSWSVNQTEQVPKNTLIAETFTSYDNTFSSFLIASSTSDVQVLPIDTTSVGKDYSSVDLFSPVEGISISLFLYSSSLNQGQSSIYTSMNNTLALFDVSSISLMVHSSYLSVESVMQSSGRSLIDSFLSFTDTFTLDRNDQSANESVTSMVVQSLTLFSSYKQVAFSSHTLSDSQFLPFNGTSSSYQLKRIATSSVNHSTQSDALSEFTFTQLNTSITPQSSHANKVSNDLSSTSMSFLSIDTLTFRRSSQSLHLSTYSSNPSFDSSTTDQSVNTPFVSTEFQFINTPLFTSVPVFLDTSSLNKFAPSTGLLFETTSVFGDLLKESMSTTIHSLSPLSSSSNLKVSSYTNVTSFSKIISSHSYHLVTSDINTIQPSETVHVFSSEPTSTTTQAADLSFLEAQVIIVPCSIAFVILVVFVPLMVMYHLGKLKRYRIRQKQHDHSENDCSSSVNFPQVFNRDFVYDIPNMGKSLPVRYHSRSLSDLPYSWNFENNWNS